MRLEISQLEKVVYLSGLLVENFKNLSVWRISDEEVGDE